MRKPQFRGKLAPAEEMQFHLPQNEIADYLRHILPELAAMANNAGMTDSAELLQMAARMSHASVTASSSK